MPRTRTAETWRRQPSGPDVGVLLEVPPLVVVHPVQTVFAAVPVQPVSSGRWPDADGDAADVRGLVRREDAGAGGPRRAGPVDLAPEQQALLVQVPVSGGHADQDAVPPPRLPTRRLPRP